MCKMMKEINFFFIKICSVWKLGYEHGGEEKGQPANFVTVGRQKEEEEERN